MNKLAFVFALLITLSACGGGGGGSSASTATNWTTTKCTSSYTNSDGIKVPCAYQTFNTTQIVLLEVTVQVLMMSILME